MPVTDAYATAAQYRTIVAKSDAGSDTDVAGDLLALSRWLDKKLGRFFTKDAAAVARVFTLPGSLRTALAAAPLGWAESENPWRYGVYSRTLSVDDLAAAPTSVKIDQNGDGLFTDETALAATDYELWPLNAALGPEPSPYTAVVIPVWSTVGGFPAGARVQVTAQWGWPAVPEAIMRATCQITGILRLESPRATQRVSELGEVIGTSRQAQEIVEKLACVYARHAGIV